MELNIDLGWIVIIFAALGIILPSPYGTVMLSMLAFIAIILFMLWAGGLMEVEKINKDED